MKVFSQTGYVEYLTLVSFYDWRNPHYLITCDAQDTGVFSM